MFGRRLRASIAADNGRSAEFIRKRTYENKQRCYECGEAGHLSYKCPVNVLGEREQPAKSTAGGLKTSTGERNRKVVDDSDDDCRTIATGQSVVVDRSGELIETKKKKFKPNSYLSDEEDVVSD